MVRPATMRAAFRHSLFQRNALCWLGRCWLGRYRLGLLCCLLGGALGCSSQKEASGPPTGLTREDGAVGRDIDPGDAPAAEEPAPSAPPQTRQDLNQAAAAEDEARQAEWARAALAEVTSPSNDLGVVVVVTERASDLLWLLAIQNRGQDPVSMVALPELLSFEVVPKEREKPAEPPPKPANRWAKPPPEPPKIICGTVPKTTAQESQLTLLPGEILVYPFDPRGYCEEPEVLAAGATIKPRYGFPLETKKVWKKGKLVEEVLPAKAPIAFELMPVGAATGPSPEKGPGDAAPSPATAPAAGANAAGAAEATPPPEQRLKHVDAGAFVLGETYPLELIAPLGRITPPASGAPLAAATPGATPPAQPGAEAAEAAAGETAPAEPTAPPPPPPPLTLTIRPMGATSNPGGSTVTVTAKNTSGRSMRLFLRRELITYQVTGPSGPTTCRMNPGARAPSPAAYSSLAAGGALSLTTRLAEACPKGTFDIPGSYTVFARIDAQNDGREHGFIAFTGTAITQQPAALTVRGTGVQTRPVMRVTSAR